MKVYGGRTERISEETFNQLSSQARRTFGKAAQIELVQPARGRIFRALPPEIIRITVKS